MTLLASRSPATAAPTRGAGHVLAPLAVAVLAAAAAAAMYRVFVRTSLGQRVDTAAMQGGDVHHPKVVEVLSRTLNGTTLASLVLVCLAAAAIGMLRRRVDLAAGAALLVIGANATTQLLKVHLARPDLDDFPAPNSFPSGHTAAAASVAFALILVLPQAVRGTVALIGACYVCVIAVATVWAEWHRPSDTIAGLLVVLAWAAMAAVGIRLRRATSTAPLSRPHRPVTVLLLAAGAVSGVAALVGFGAVVLSEKVTPALVSGRFAFLTGAAGIAAAVAAVFLLWLRLAAADNAADRPAPEPAPPTRKRAPAKPADGGATTTKPGTRRQAAPEPADRDATAPNPTVRKPATPKPAARKPARDSAATKLIGRRSAAPKPTGRKPR